jgi:VanZ family protein
VSGRLKRWWPALLWASAIFYLSSRSTLPSLPPGLLSWDKLQHATAYGVGGVAFAYALRVPAWEIRAGWLPWLAAALSSLYGMSDEIHQYFVPGRNSDWRDWVADTTGALAGVLLYRMYLAWRGRHHARAGAGALKRT